MGFFGSLQEHKDRLKNFLDKLTNDAHIPIALIVFAATFGYCAKTGKDLLPGFVSSLYAFYAFLGGHALVYQKWPDSDANHDGIPDTQQAPTVNVNVDNTANAAGTGSAGAKG